MSVDGEEVDAELDGGLRVPDRRALVQDGGAGGFQLLDHWAGRVAGGFDDGDFLLDDDARVGGVVRGHHGGEEGEVDAEGVFGHGAAAADFFAQVLRGGLGEGCELEGVLVSLFSFSEFMITYYSQTTGVGHGGGEFGVPDPLHTALHDRNWRGVSLWTLSVWCEHGCRGGHAPLMPRARVSSVLNGMMT
jgi:hypothetical protein